MPRFEEMDAGRAYWNQRGELAGNAARIRALSEAVGRPGDLFLTQWAQLMAMTLEFRPDLVIELGRGYGNSTCAFAESLRMARNSKGSVVSLCLSDDWDRLTLPRILPLVDAAWLAPVKALKENILTFDFAAETARKERVLVFWDAHGFDIAECVLGKILPLIAGKAHLVIMHDLSDARFSGAAGHPYGDNGLWKGNAWDGRRMLLGHIDTAVEQAIAAVDFTSRNRIALHSADESIHNAVVRDAARLAEIKETLGGMFAPQAHWFYFTLNEQEGAFTFPKFTSPPPPAAGARSGPEAGSLFAGLKTGLKKILNG